MLSVAVLLRRMTAAAALLLLLGGCADWLLPSSVEVGSGQMQQALERRFPLEKHYAGLVDVTLSHPLVGVLPQQQRITLQFDSLIRLAGSGRPYAGHTQVSSALAWDAPDKTIVLDHPQLDSQHFEGMSDAMNVLLSQALAVAVNERLDGMPVYHFTPDDLKLLGSSVRPERIEIDAGGVAIHFSR